MKKKRSTKQEKGVRELNGCVEVIFQHWKRPLRHAKPQQCAAFLNIREKGLGYK